MTATFLPRLRTARFAHLSAAGIERTFNCSCFYVLSIDPRVKFCVGFLYGFVVISFQKGKPSSSLYGMCALICSGSFFPFLLECLKLYWGVGASTSSKQSFSA